MRIMTHRERRAALYGWLWYTPVLAVLFSPLFFDAWLNTQNLRADYRLGEVSNELRELRAQLDTMRVEAAGRQAMDNLAQAAPGLGMQEPAPGQIEIVRYDPERDGVPALPQPFVMAQLEGKEAVREMASGLPMQSLAGLMPALLATTNDKAADEKAAETKEKESEPVEKTPPGPVRLEALTPAEDLQETAAPAPGTAPVKLEAASPREDETKSDKLAMN